MSKPIRAAGEEEPERDLVENQQRALPVELRSLRAYLAKAKKELRLERRAVGIRFIDDREMTRLNETYRHKKGSTDVLSFPFEDSAAAKGKSRRNRRAQYLGDIAISPRVARRNARQYGRTLPGELRILILHGLLHLLGYDHETDGGEMDRKEQRLRRRLRLT
jgi:probable rRNA maturation factor